MDEHFKAPYGRALLRHKNGSMQVRLALEPVTNVLVCALPDVLVGLTLRDSGTVTLTDVELFAEGNRWTTPEITDLVVLESSGGSIGASNSRIGALTAQDPPMLLRVARNGRQQFSLDLPVAPSIEFSGGSDLSGPLQLTDGLVLRTRNGRIILEGAECSTADVSRVRLALSLAFGTLCWERFRASGTSLTVTFQQRLESKRWPNLIFDRATNGYVDHEKVARGVRDVLQCTLRALSAQPKRTSPSLDHVIEWFLAARSVEGLVDFRALCLYSFIELLDGSKTLNGHSLSALLGIPLATAKALVQVRNDVSHGSLSLDGALRKQPELTSDFFGDLVVGDYRLKPTSTLMNYMVFSTNKLMLSAVGCSISPGTWV